MTDARPPVATRPPGADERIGTERARELVAALREIALPVVDAAEADLRSRLEPDTEIVRSGAPMHYIARIRFGPEMESLCVGVVYQAASSVWSTRRHRATRCRTRSSCTAMAC